MRWQKHLGRVVVIKVIKRDGRTEEFNVDKIAEAIKKAAIEVENKDAENSAKYIAEKIRFHFDYNDSNKINVDIIHDTVESYLMKQYPDVAKAYILYRQNRTDIREGKSKIMKAITEISREMHKDNANTGNSAASKMYGIAEAANKEYVLSQLMNPVHAENHRKGRVYVNDLGYYQMTFNCFFNPIGEMLRKGFDNGIGSIRPPKRIGSAVALVAIILQSSQNDMFGGQGIVNFDTDLAPYVRAEYEWQLKNISESVSAIAGWREERPREPEDYAVAMKLTEEAVYQAMEAFVYNMNTMRSRSGAQVTFSSVNFGTDTSDYARMISRNLLKAYIAGLGNGENPMFPNLCFRLKDGVNMNEGEPNYDLFKLALECVGKRIQPRFVFADSPAYPKWQDAATMGCVDGDEVIVYKHDGNIHIDGFKRLWRRTSINIQKQGLSSYVHPENLEIWDGERGFVKVKTVVKNPDMHNWVRITFSNGRSVLVTSDHPLYIKDKGRIFVKQLKIGDEIKAYYNFPNIANNNEMFSVESAYLLGILVTDGNYSQDITATFDCKTEQDIIRQVRTYAKIAWDKDTSITEYRRGDKGNYDMVRIKTGKDNGKLRNGLSAIFGGVMKADRSIPSEIFTSSKEIKLSFLAGLIDADGYVNKKSKVQIGSTNKELALQQLALAQSLGIIAKMYLNHYDTTDKTKIRYRVEFSMTKDIEKFMASKKKVAKWNGVESKTKTPEYIAVTKIEYLGFLDKPSYDVETETDKFTLSFIESANCRTAVRSNINGSQSPNARGNLAFNNISLPYIALESPRLGDFYENLDKTIDQAIDQLLERYKIMCSLKVKDVPFVSQWYQEYEGLSENDSIEPMIKNGSLSVGFIGLAECLTALYGQHHGEDKDSQFAGYGIVHMIRRKTDEATKKYGLNFSCFATPSESACYTLLKKARDRFGVIEGVTDKEFFTNSFHLPVDFHTDIQTKIDIEAPYHLLCNAGAIMYVELGSSPKDNIEGLEEVIKYMAKSGAVYGGANWEHDFCCNCHYQGTFDGACPICGSKNIKRSAIITGYLSTVNKFNQGKVAELKSRVSHGGGSIETSGN